MFNRDNIFILLLIQKFAAELDGCGHELELEPGVERVGLLDDQVGSLCEMLLACLLVCLPVFVAHVLPRNGRAQGSLSSRDSRRLIWFRSQMLGAQPIKIIIFCTIQNLKGMS